MNEKEAHLSAWFITIFVVSVFCFVLGWMMGFGAAPRPLQNPFADGASHPFGTEDADAGLDFDASDSPTHKRDF